MRAAARALSAARDDHTDLAILVHIVIVREAVLVLELPARKDELQLGWTELAPSKAHVHAHVHATCTRMFTCIPESVERTGDSCAALP